MKIFIPTLSTGPFTSGLNFYAQVLVESECKDLCIIAVNLATHYT
jgi:hypothetical protein